IADVAFDAPLAHPFSYRVPDGWQLAPGQRVLAPLRGAARVGMVVALREGVDARLEPLLRVAHPAPILVPAHVDFVLWLTAGSPGTPAWARGPVLRRGDSWPTARRGSRPARARRCWRLRRSRACSSCSTSTKPPTSRRARRASIRARSCSSARHARA